MDARRRLSAFAREHARRQTEIERTRERLREERDDAIRHAYEAGMTMDEIAAIVGLSQQRISQIIRGG
mgnify:CR=1 FL=1